MPVALVETKFFLPRARAGLVLRPRLDELLSKDRARLTLVSAPAGFGKTTLLATWLSQVASESGTPRHVAWVSLDQSDREAATFWTYALTALDRAVPGSGSAGLMLLGSGQSVGIALSSVLNELSVIADDVDLVLDDYHLAESPEIQPGLAFLLERLPPNVRLVISSRADPALPLARLRARGELTEVRATHLRFTDDEASSFLASATGLKLTPADVAALGARTEGWIASLQLAALSLRDREDPSGFIAGFAGDDRYVVDYLVEEVLDHEPPEVRDFLVVTSILERLTGPLCDAVTAMAGGSTMLDSLERRNLFMVPLDEQRRWYRYHHLFAEMLRTHLLAERHEEDVRELHRRASRWYAAARDTTEAVRHALAAGDFDSAADLVELALPALRRDRREFVIRRWVDELPADVVRNRPVLAAGFIGALMASNEFDAVGSRLRDLAELLAGPSANLMVVDSTEFARLPGVIETWWAGLSLVGGDLTAATAHAERGAAAAAPGDDVTVAAAGALAGLASWAGGDVPAAHRGYATAAQGLTRAGHIADVLGCSVTLADMELTLGRLRDAERTLQDALELAARNGPAGPNVMRGTADMLVGLSRAAWHRNDLAASADLLRRAGNLGDGAGLPQNPYRWRVAMARQRTATGDFAGALELLDEAERVYVGDFSPPVHPIHATRARLLVASGDMAAALAWAQRHHLRADDEPTYLREYEHLTLAHVLLAQHRSTGTSPPLEQAIGLLDRLLVAAQAGGRLGVVLEIQSLRTVAHLAGGGRDTAHEALEHAVALAEPEGWIRYFVDGGLAMAAALADVIESRPRSAYIQRLFEVIGPIGLAPENPEPVHAGTVVVQSALEALLDPLSDREVDVLRLLGSDLDGPAIARELVVSLNTVRTHTKHIYTKLGVNNRRSAITRAHLLGLLARSTKP